MASAIETDNATAATRESIVLVPSTIPAGFYDVVTMSLTRGRISSTTVTSRHVIQIGPGR